MLTHKAKLILILKSWLQILVYSSFNSGITNHCKVCLHKLTFTILYMFVPFSSLIYKLIFRVLVYLVRINVAQMIMII